VSQVTGPLLAARCSLFEDSLIPGSLSISPEINWDTTTSE
jgi:hypothetical protein